VHVGALRGRVRESGREKEREAKAREGMRGQGTRERGYRQDTAGDTDGERGHELKYRR